MKLGAGAAWTALAAALAYDAAQILQVAGLLRDPLDRILIFAPSLLLAPSFAIAVSASLDAASPDQRPWRRRAPAWRCSMRRWSASSTLSSSVRSSLRT